MWCTAWRKRDQAQHIHGVDQAITEALADSTSPENAKKKKKAAINVGPLHATLDRSE